MYISKLINNSYGDTIVEVLISITVLSLILTGAYVTSNQSLRQIRSAQEKIQALGIAQTQVENLRAQSVAIFGIPGNAQYHAPINKAFCFNNVNTFLPQPIVEPPVGNPGSCVFNSGVSVVSYTVTITGEGIGKTGTNPLMPIDTYSFDINVKWLSATSDIKYDQVNIHYRVSI